MVKVKGVAAVKVIRAIIMVTVKLAPCLVPITVKDDGNLPEAEFCPL